MADGNIEIEVELDDSGIASEAQAVGKEAGEGIEKGIGEGTQKSGSLLDGLKGKFSTVFAAMGGIAAGFSLAEVAGEIVNTGKQFEASMSNVAALSGAADEALESLEAKARELGASTTFSASEAADALGYMALAGWDTAEMLDGVDGVLTLAQAGQMDLASSSDLVTDYLSAFGMEASETGRMVDVLAYAQANANTTVEGLGMAFKNAAANAHAAGLDVETTTAAISMMANQGLKGSEAGTALTAVMRDMTQKMSDGTIKIGETAVEVQDAQGNFRDFADILSDVEAATDGMGTAERSAALMTTFTADSVKGLNLLLSAGSGELASFREELYGSSGAAQGLADTMTDNLEGDLKAMNSAWEEFQLKVYEGAQEPLRDLAQLVTSTVIPGMTYLLENLDKVGPVLATIGVMIVAYRNNWDLVTAAQNLAAKATTANVTANTTLTKALASTTVGSKALAVAQTVQAAATTLAGKAAQVAGKAIKSMAPVALLSAVMSIVEGFIEEAKAAKEVSDANEKLRDSMASLSRAGIGVADAADDYVESAQSVIDASRKAINAQADFAESMSSSFAEVSANSQLVDEYVATIDRLAGQSDLSAEEQGELTAAVSGLNSVCGTSYEVIDAVNGQLSAGTDIIDANAEAWKRNAEAQALQEAYQDAVKNRIMQEEQLATVAEKAANAEKGVGLYIGDFAVAADFAAVEAHDLAKQTEYQQETAETAAEVEAHLKERLDEATAAAAESTAATEEQNEALAEQAAEAEAAAEANQELVDAVNKAAAEHAGFAEAMAEAGYTAEDMARALEASGVTADDLASSIESLQEKTANAFDVIEQKSDISLDSMMETLTKNAETTRDWSENVQALYDRAGSGIEEQFVAYLADLGPEYSSILGELVEATPEKLAEMANAWAGGMDTARDAAVTEAQVTSDEVVAAIEDGGERAAEASQSMGEGVGEGIEAGSADAGAAVESTVSQAADGAVSAMESKAPEMEAAGGQVMLSAAEGAESVGTAGMTAAASESASAAVGAMEAAVPQMQAATRALFDAAGSGASSAQGEFGEYGKAASAAYASGIEGGKAQAVASATAMASESAQALGSSNGEASGIGANLVQGVINGASGMAGALTSAARSLAKAAVDAMKSELDIHSPSKKTETEIGKNYALGVARGITNNSKYAKKSASEVGEAIVSAAKTKLSNLKRVSDVSLKEEAAYWKAIVSQTKKGTKARSEAALEYKAVLKQIKDEQKKDQQTLLKAEAEYKEKVREIAADLAEDIKKVESQLAEDIADVQKQLAEDIAEAWDNYYDAVESRAQSILSSFSMFDRFRVQSQRSAAVLIENMKTQAEAAEEYREQMEKLRARIGDGDMFNEIAEQGVDALGQIRTINEMSEDEIAEYMDLYTRRNEAALKEATAENDKLLAETKSTVAQLTSDASKEMANLRSAAKKEIAQLTADASAETKAAAKELAETASELGTQAAKAVAKMAKSIATSAKGTVSNINKAIAAIQKLNKAYTASTGTRKATTTTAKTAAASGKARAVTAMALEAEPTAYVYDGSGALYGVARAAQADYLSQVSESIAKAATALTVAASARASEQNVTNTQNITFNAPVSSPDEVARTMRMQQRYGLAGEY